jgi:hypothetical protein
MVLEAGTTGKSINKVADAHKIALSALLRDVRAFKKAGVKGMLRRSRRVQVLIARGAWDDFVIWCDKGHKLTGKSPRASGYFFGR